MGLLNNFGPHEINYEGLKLITGALGLRIKSKLKC
jgi:hypothetical protein